MPPRNPVPPPGNRGRRQQVALSRQRDWARRVVPQITEEFNDEFESEEIPPQHNSPSGRVEAEVDEFSDDSFLEPGRTPPTAPQIPVPRPVERPNAPPAKQPFVEPLERLIRAFGELCEVSATEGDDNRQRGTS